MPELKDSFCVLQLISPGPLQRANLRSFLNGKALYIEIGDCFFISLEPALKGRISRALKNDGTNFILAFTNLRAGADVLTNGITKNDKTKLEQMIWEDQ